LGVFFVVLMVTRDAAVPFEAKLTVVGFRLTVGPVGETEEKIEVFPANPPRLVRVIVEEPEEPGDTVW
jgi:hypothetical protein